MGSIVCNNSDVAEVREKLTLCGIKFETSYYSEGRTYFGIWGETQEQIDRYESMIED